MVLRYETKNDRISHKIRAKHWIRTHVLLDIYKEEISLPFQSREPHILKKFPQVCTIITRQAIKLESCLNPLKNLEIFLA